MRIPGANSNQWFYYEASSAARAVVYAGSSGDRLPIDSFVDAMGEGFGAGEQVVNYQMGRLGNGHMAVFLIDRLRATEPEKVTSSIEEVSMLAGNPDAAETAERFSEVLFSGNNEETLAMIRSIGTQAASNIARRPGQKGWRLAKRHQVGKTARAAARALFRGPYYVPGTTIR